MTPVVDAFALASRCYSEGDLAHAEQHLWSILSKDANHPEALRLFGVIARQKGDLVQAIDYLNRSLICNRANAITWKNLGDAHFFAGNFRAGVAHYEQALLLQPNYAEAYNKMGIALDYLGDVEYAAIAFEAGLRVKADSPEIAYNFGTFLYKEGELDRAADYFRQALRLNPNYADASVSLAIVFKEQGLFDQAIAQFLEALKLQPDHALALYNLSELAAEGRYHFTPDQLQRIKDCLVSGHYSILERSHFGFALASVLNRNGSYDEAFRYYEQANNLKKRLLRENNKVFDIHAFQAFVDRIMAIHDQAYFERVRGWGIESELPVFIVGMPRSGSTLVEQILASHPRVFGAGEIGEIRKFVTRLAKAPKSWPFLPNQNAARDLATAYIKHIANLGKGAARVTIKALNNYVYLAEIATLFPYARIIHCRRDPLDVCLSCYFQNFEEMPFTCSLDDIGACYLAYERLMAHWCRVLPLEIHEVCYEELIHDQEIITRKLLAHCGLDWDERCLTFFNTRRVVRTASSVQVRKPVSSHAIGRWKQYRCHLDPLFKALGLPV